MAAPTVGVQCIVLTPIMRDMHIANADLNLLRALEVLLDERHVSRAAARSHLSQSAMSRTLSRLREMFEDELLVRTQGGYELTPRARALQEELAGVMPRLRTLVRGSSFDPGSASDTFRVAASDYPLTVLGDHFFPPFTSGAPHLSLVVTPVLPSTFADLDHGRIDLALTPIEAPAHLHRQTLFTEDFVCMVSTSHPLTADRVTVDDLAGYPHASVGGMHAHQMLVMDQLEKLGIHAPAGVRVPYFSTAVTAVRGTTLIAVVPRRFARRYADASVRVLEAPHEITGFTYPMLWHPRLTNDHAHRWLRSVLALAAASLVASDPPVDSAVSPPRDPSRPTTQEPRAT